MTPDDDTKSEIARLDERIASLRRDMERSEAHSQVALNIASSEIARRLHDLNGEAERLRKMQETYVPRGEYGIQQAESDKRIRTLEDKASNLAGRMTAVHVVWGLFVMVMSGIVAFVVRVASK